MKMIRFALAAMIMLLGPALWMSEACATGGGSGGSTATQGQAQTMQNDITIIQPGQQGSSGGGGSTEVPRSWYVPPVPPAAPNYPYYGGPYRWGKELTPEGNIYKFKQVWNVGELRKLNERPGKLRVSETVYVAYPFSPLVQFETNMPPNEVSWHRFRQCYELIGEIAVEGVAEKSTKFAKDQKNQIGDSQKIRGFVGTRACEIGGDLVLLYQQDGNFEQYGDSRYTSIGLSVGLMSGGSGAAQAGSIGFSRTWGTARIGYNTLPYGVYLVFKNTGRKYVPYFPPPPVQRPAPPQMPQTLEKAKERVPGPVNNNHGGKGVEDISGTELPYKRPPKQLLIHEEDGGKKSSMEYKRPDPQLLQQEKK